VQDVNEPPVVSAQTRSASEAQGTGFQLGAALVANDPDGGDSISWSWTLGSGSIFALDSETGEVTLTASAAGKVGTYTTTVTATDDGGLTSSATLTLEITDHNWAPTCTSATASVAENSAVSTLIATVQGQDQDTDDTLTWSIDSLTNQDGAFSIDSTTGKLRVAKKSSFDFEGTPSRNVSIVVTDDGPGKLRGFCTITVVLTNVNEKP